MAYGDAVQHCVSQLASVLHAASIGFGIIFGIHLRTLFAGFRPHRDDSWVVLNTLGLLRAPSCAGPQNAFANNFDGAAPLLVDRRRPGRPAVARVARPSCAKPPRAAFTGVVAASRGRGARRPRAAAAARRWRLHIILVVLSLASYRRGDWRDEYYDDDHAVRRYAHCGFLGLSIGIDILVDPDSKPIPDGCPHRKI